MIYLMIHSESVGVRNGWTDLVWGRGCDLGGGLTPLPPIEKKFFETIVKAGYLPKLQMVVGNTAHTVYHLHPSAYQ